MDIKSVSHLSQVSPKDLQSKATKKELPKQTPADQGVVFEKSSASGGIQGDYSKMAKESQQLSEVDKLKMQIDHKMKGAFYMMVKDVMDGQNMGMKAAIERIFEERGEEITPEMVEEAKADVGEGGFFSVEKVTERIMHFAKSISGDDPSKAGLLKDAFIQGFEEAEKIWGDALPQISKDTYDSVMKAFDEWESGATEK